MPSVVEAMKAVHTSIRENSSGEWSTTPLETLEYFIASIEGVKWRGGGGGWRPDGDRGRLQSQPRDFEDDDPSEVRG